MRGKLRKVMATLLLMYALADLSIPGLCRESRDGPNLGPVAIQMATQHSGGPVTSQGPDEDNCFCCCSHILPSLPLSLASGVLTDLAWGPQSPPLVSFEITPLHQPPRL